MSADNVTPFKGKGDGEKTSEPPPDDDSPEIGLSFRDMDDAPGSLRVFQALRAVCSAAERAGLEEAQDEFVGLGTAADILCEMLEDRMVHGP